MLVSREIGGNLGQGLRESSFRFEFSGESHGSVDRAILEKVHFAILQEGVFAEDLLRIGEVRESLVEVGREMVLEERVDMGVGDQLDDLATDLGVIR